MGISFNRKVREIFESLTASLGLQLAMKSKAAKHLCHLDVKEIWGEKGGFRSEDPFSQESPDVRPKKDLDRSGGIEDDQKPSRKGLTSTIQRV